MRHTSVTSSRVRISCFPGQVFVTDEHLEGLVVCPVAYLEGQVTVALVLLDFWRFFWSAVFLVVFSGYVARSQRWFTF